MIGGILVSLALFIGFAKAQEESDCCLMLYRRDIMQRWCVKNGSQLCTINKPSLDPEQFGLTIKDGTKLYVSCQTDNNTLDDNWKTESVSEDIYGVSVYRTNATRQESVLRLENTDNKTLIGTFARSHNVTTYYTATGEVSVFEGLYNKFITRSFLVIFILVGVGLSFRFNYLCPMTCGIALLIISSSVILATLTITSTLLLVLILLGIAALAGLIGWALYAFGKGNEYFGWGAFVLFAAFLFVCSQLISSLIDVASIIVILGVALGFAWKEHVFSRWEMAQSFLTIGIFYATAMLAMNTSLTINLPSLYLNVSTKWSGYKEGPDSSWLGLALITPVLWVGAIVLEIALCYRMKTKLDDSAMDYSIVKM